MSGLAFRDVALSWAQLIFPRSVDPDAVQAFVASVVSDRSLGPVVFETSVDRGGVGCFMMAARNLNRLSATLSAFVPGIQVVPIAGGRRVGGRAGWRLQMVNTARPLDTSDPSGVSARLLGSLADQPSSRHQLVLGERLSPVAVPSRVEMVPGSSWPAALVGAALVGRRRVDTEARRALSNKRGLAGVRANVRLIHDGRSHGGWEAALQSTRSAGLQLRVRPDRVENARDAISVARTSVPLNVAEIVTLLGWPYGGRSYPGVDRSGPTPLPPIKAAGEPDRLIGYSTFPGSSKIPVGVSVQDSLRHLHVLGPTGVGKSTLLANLILGDITAGRGVVVVDPKGDLITDVLASVPKSEVGRLMLLDPAAGDRMVGFNPLAVPASARELAVDSLVHVVKELNLNSWGPRTQDILHASLLTLIGTEHASIVLVPTLLTNSRFRDQILTRTVSSVHLRGFWGWFDALSPAERSSVIAPVLNKLRPLLFRTSLRTMLGQTKPSIDLGSVFTDRRVLLVPLRKGEVGAETAALLGAMIVSGLWQHAQGRTAVPAVKRRPVMIYLDEFQDYLKLPTDLADVLAQARGLGVGLTLAHQHLAQLRADVKAAVLANAQSRVLFRLGHEDAAVFARSNQHLEQLDFTGLGRYQIYTDLLTAGELSGPMSARTPKPPKPRRNPTKLTRHLSGRDGASVADVDRFLAEAAQPELSPSSPSPSNPAAVSGPDSPPSPASSSSSPSLPSASSSPPSSSSPSSFSVGRRPRRNP